MKAHFPPDPTISLLMREDPCRVTLQSPALQQITHPVCLSRLCKVQLADCSEPVPESQGVGQALPKWPRLVSTGSHSPHPLLSLCPTLSLFPLPASVLLLTWHFIPASKASRSIYGICMQCKETVENGPGSFSNKACILVETVA